MPSRKLPPQFSQIHQPLFVIKDTTNLLSLHDQQQPQQNAEAEVLQMLIYLFVCLFILNWWQLKIYYCKTYWWADNINNGGLISYSGLSICSYPVILYSGGECGAPIISFVFFWCFRGLINKYSKKYFSKNA